MGVGTDESGVEPPHSKGRRQPRGAKKENGKRQRCRASRHKSSGPHKPRQSPALGKRGAEEGFLAPKKCPGREKRASLEMTLGKWVARRQKLCQREKSGPAFSGNNLKRRGPRDDSARDGSETRRLTTLELWR